MAGRAYTMKEMRGIVDYIKERKAFSETRARKMWMDFANSDLTNRTWQSLKETFLKRILPDIHNPYYKLTTYELRSFREGREIRPSENKLEFKSATPGNPESNTVVQNDQEPSTSHNKHNGHKSGEDVKCSKIDNSRESVDTIILTAEDSEEAKKEKVASPQKTKSLREQINYTEPLTPMLQEILCDFSSDDEPQLTIDEERVTQNDTPDIEKILSNDDTETQKPDGPETFDSHPLNKDVSQTIKRSIKRALRLKSSEKDKNKEVSGNTSDTQKSQINPRVTRSRKSESKIEEADENSNNITPQKTQIPSSNSITDSLLPNNQEALEDKTNTEQDTSKNKSMEAPQIKTPMKSLKPKKKKSGIDSSEPPKSKPRTPKIKWKRVESVSETDQIVVTSPNAKKNATKGTDNESEAEKKDDVEVVESNKENTEDDIVVPSQPLSNPCLQSVSLYEEHSATMNISDNDEDNLEVAETNTKANDNTKAKNQVAINQTIETSTKEFKKLEKATKDKSKSPLKSTSQELVEVPVEKEVLFLKSDSDSESEGLNTQEIVKQKKVSINPKKLTKQRSKVLKNLFDGGSRNTKKHGYRNGTVPQHILQVSSGSSDWTSESEDEFVSPPRGRNRRGRRYLKPNSARILALEQEGGLFVACGKKVYPLVKDGKLIKNYLTYDPESDTEEKEELYWQQKYLEEKKRTAELTKLLKNSNEEVNKRRSEFQSPILPSKSVKIDRSLPIHDITSSIENLHGSEIVPKVEEPKEDKTVKIKFAKANEEVFLEGNWQNLHHILGDVMQIFHKDRPDDERTRRPEADKCPVVIEEAEEEVHKKIDQLEEEIFREIEEIDKSAEQESLPMVTERKRRSKPLPPRSPAKRSRPSTAPSTSTSPAVLLPPCAPSRRDSEIIINEAKLTPVAPPAPDEAAPPPAPDEAAPPPAPARRATSKTNIEPEKKPEKMNPRTSNQRSKKSQSDEDDNVTLYKFPSPAARKRGGKAYAPNTTVRLSVMSPESTQGYQDSDDSPKYNLRKKRKSMTYILQGKNKYSKNMRKKVYDFDASDESSNSLPSAPKTVKNMPKMLTIQNVTVNTEVYRTESYQLLMPSITLERLDESPCPNDIDSTCGNNSLHLSPASQNLSKTDKSDSTISINVQIEGSSSNVSLPLDGNSSNVSLPLSPELSIVENISINKNVLNTVEYPTINETQANDLMNSENKYLMSHIDVSLPLMEQDSVKMSVKNEVCPMDVSETKTVGILPDDVMVKDGMGEDVPTLTETLDERMKELMLESAKKTKGSKSKKKVVKKKPKEEAAKNAQKRCSTPRKKKTIPKSRAPSVDAVIEEQMEYCSNGRKSCPPVICAIVNQNKPTEKTKQPTKKVKKTKEIIKVKIQKPKPKNEPKKRDTKSVQMDSGINETGISFLDFNNSVDLIHNHSETCLANECYDSVILMENSKSVISLDSTGNGCEGLAVEMLSCDATDGMANFAGLKEKLSPSTQVEYHTPPASISSLNSILTEDLSDEIPKLKTDWYLVSDEELTVDPPPCTIPSTTEANKNWLPSQSNSSYMSANDGSPVENDGTNLPHLFSSRTSFGIPEENNFSNMFSGTQKSSGSNLKQLFPVACSVPNLSTITEGSRETEPNTCDVSLMNEFVGDSFLDDFITCSNNC